MGIHDRDYMKGRAAGDSDRGGDGGGVPPDQRLAEWLGGWLRRYPRAPKVLLWVVIGLVLAGLALSFL